MEQPVRDQRPGQADRPGWVLVCDDTESIRLLIRINLELAGFDVIEAEHGQAALDLLAEESDRRPGVVILDAQMEPRDGWWATEQIRQDSRLCDLPVVMVTAALRDHQRARAGRAGVDAFVGKPFDPDALVALVQGFAAEGRAFRSWGHP